MTRKTIYFIALALLFVGSATAQNKTFEEKAKLLSIKIDSISSAERTALKKEIRGIEKLYNNDEITLEQATQKKEDATILHANIIKTEVAKIEKEVHNLVQNRVDAKINSNKEDNATVYSLGLDGFKMRKYKKNRRTYSYLVLAIGFNNLINDMDINSIQDSQFEFSGSRFFEFGLNHKTRIFKENSVPYINYGLSVRYNNLRPKNNQFFETNGDNTLLQVHSRDLRRSYFRNVQLVFPIFLEFDFSKPKVIGERTVFRRNKSVRFGFGGFGGINIKSKQVLKYKLDGKRVREKTKGDFNVNRFVYGLNAFVGYKDTSFYVKYDLQDLFKNDFNKQKNISFGVRFDL